MVRVTFERVAVDTASLLSNASGTFKPGAATRRTASSHWTLDRGENWKAAGTSFTLVPC